MVTRRRFGFVLALVLAGVALSMGGARPVAAASPVILTPVPPGDQEPGKTVALAVRITDAATNRPVGNLDVQFYVMTQVFGPRLMAIGHALTDATGRAAVSYKPSWEGDTAVTARFVGNAQYTTAEVSYRFAAVGPVPTHQNAAFGLEPIRALAPVVVILLVIGVWAALIAVGVHTVLGLRSPAFAGRTAASPALAAGRQAAAQEPVDGAS